MNYKNIFIWTGVIIVLAFLLTLAAVQYVKSPTPAPAQTVEQQGNGSSTVTATAGGREGEHCGGNMANAPQCSVGFHCAPVPGSHLPYGDVGGQCVKN